jgi:two-component sensor histidine kinase
VTELQRASREPANAIPRGAMRGWAGLVRRLRAGQRRPADPDRTYRTLFECVSDGFALVEVIRDGEGRVADYLVLEANPALMRMLSISQSPVGKRAAEVLHNPPAAWIGACDQAMRSGALSFEFHSPGADRWFEIHLSRITDTQLAQLVVDITDRKRLEQRNSEMFDELNHRVKNNLAIVSAMLSMQSRRASSPELRAQLETAVDRIQTIADVHASLYRKSGKDEVDFAAYLQDLCERLRRSVLDPDRIDLEVVAEPADLPLDKAVAMGVVVNELVTNAAKHAYPPPTRGPVSVKLRHVDGELVLTVGDSGKGLPAEPPPTGLGMRLVRSLVQQLGARLEVVHSPGAAFQVRLPDPQRPARAAGQPSLL